ncbi:unnamed protein product [Adineta ricciae]|uniref:Uncharacterized protein n=1 Tax=Adineta ricciae TaxID=249248 RepID=A0A814L042_ADIRI|nr:unnamed protein product [Adineta ricciae]
MIRNENAERNRCIQQQTDANRNDCDPNGKKNSDQLTNRRHSIAHTNFRKAIYRSLSLSNDLNDWKSYIKYCLKIFAISLLVVLIGAFVKRLWHQHRH